MKIILVTAYSFLFLLSGSLLLSCSKDKKVEHRIAIVEKGSNKPVPGAVLNLLECGFSTCNGVKASYRADANGIVTFTTSEYPGYPAVAVEHPDYWSGGAEGSFPEKIFLFPFATLKVRLVKVANDAADNKIFLHQQGEA